MVFDRRRRCAKRAPLTASKLRKQEASMRSAALPAELAPPMMQCASISCKSLSAQILLSSQPSRRCGSLKPPAAGLFALDRHISLGVPPVDPI